MRNDGKVYPVRPFEAVPIVGTLILTLYPSYCILNVAFSKNGGFMETGANTERSMALTWQMNSSGWCGSNRKEVPVLKTNGMGLLESSKTLLNT